MIITIKQQDNIAIALLAKWMERQDDGFESSIEYAKMDEFYRWQRRQSVRDFGEEIITFLDNQYITTSSLVEFEQEEIPKLPPYLK